MPLKIGLVYQGYCAADTTTEDEVRAVFIKKYGYEPEVVEQRGPNWLVGPIRGGQNLDLPTCPECGGSGYVADGRGSAEPCGCNAC